MLIKSVKWVRRLRFTGEQELGYWEKRGYSNTADPWKQQKHTLKNPVTSEWMRLRAQRGDSKSAIILALEVGFEPKLRWYYLPQTPIFCLDDRV